MESLARQGDPESLARLANLKPLPPRAAHVWRYFRELSAERRGTGFGPARLSRLDIHAWERDEGVFLARWERRAVMAIDALYVANQAEQINQAASKGGKRDE